MSDLLKIAADAENDCSCALWDYPEALRSAHVRIEELEAEQDRLSSKVDTLELLRPHWAQGYSSDSVAAQASTAALVAFWEILGVSDQTSAINALKALTDQLAKAVEALRFVVSAKGLTDPTEYGYEAIKQARTALAEIEGEKT